MPIIARLLGFLVSLLAPLVPYVLDWVSSRIKKKEQQEKDEQAIKDKDAAIGQELKQAEPPQDRDKAAQDVAKNF
jgi:hypothetical protein